jgi:hypothetical protein
MLVSVLGEIDYLHIPIQGRETDRLIIVPIARMLQEYTVIVPGISASVLGGFPDWHSYYL